MRKSTWQSDNAECLQSLPLNLILLPGTHNSGCCQIVPVCLSSDNLADTLLSWAIKVVPCLIRPWACTQGAQLYEQLMLGVRFLDIRISLAPPQAASRHGKFYVSHTCACMEAEDAFQQVSKFLNGHKGEIVLLRLTRDWAHRSAIGPNEGMQLLRILWRIVGQHMMDRTTLMPPGSSAWPTYGEAVATGRQLAVLAELPQQPTSSSQPSQQSCASADACVCDGNCCASASSNLGSQTTASPYLTLLANPPPSTPFATDTKHMLRQCHTHQLRVPHQCHTHQLPAIYMPDTLALHSKGADTATPPTTDMSPSSKPSHHTIPFIAHVGAQCEHSAGSAPPTSNMSPSSQPSHHTVPFSPHAGAQCEHSAGSAPPTSDMSPSSQPPHHKIPFVAHTGAQCEQGAASTPPTSDMSPSSKSSHHTVPFIAHAGAQCEQDGNEQGGAQCGGVSASDTNQAQGNGTNLVNYTVGALNRGCAVSGSVTGDAVARDDRMIWGHVWPPGTAEALWANQPTAQGTLEGLLELVAQMQQQQQQQQQQQHQQPPPQHLEQMQQKGQHQEPEALCVNQPTAQGTLEGLLELVAQQQQQQQQPQNLEQAQQKGKQQQQQQLGQGLQRSDASIFEGRQQCLTTLAIRSISGSHQQQRPDPWANQKGPRQATAPYRCLLVERLRAYHLAPITETQRQAHPNDQRLQKHRLLKRPSILKTASVYSTSFAITPRVSTILADTLGGLLGDMQFGLAPLAADMQALLPEFLQHDLAGVSAICMDYPTDSSVEAVIGASVQRAKLFCAQ